RMEIVNVFKRLRDDEGVTVIYITHDLATAYYVSDRIAIMLRGHVVESGPVQAVLTGPAHPYARLLEESIPERVPEDRGAWTPRSSVCATGAGEFSRAGCKFAARCPSVMERCRVSNPPDFVVGNRLVKGCLYDDEGND